MWRYEKSSKVITIDDKFSKFSNVVNNHNMILIPKNIIEHLKDKTGFYDLSGNCELVLKIIGMRLPPNQWCRVKTLAKEQQQ